MKNNYTFCKNNGLLDCSFSSLAAAFEDVRYFLKKIVHHATIDRDFFKFFNCYYQKLL